MNKLINLFDFEFKRNLKHYITIILLSCLCLFINLTLNLKTHNEGIKETLQTKTIEEITARVGGFNFSNLIIENTSIVISIGFVICVLYSIFIWQKEFIFKNKSINTLMMMPQGRGIVYTSKLMNMVCFIYIYIISIVLTLFISYKILPNFMMGNIENLSFVQSTMYKLSLFIPYTYTDFIIECVFLLPSLITILFVFILSYKYYTNKFSKIIVQIILVLSLPFVICIPLAFLLFVDLINNSVIILISSVVIVGGYMKSKNILDNGLDY